MNPMENPEGMKPHLMNEAELTGEVSRLESLFNNRQATSRESGRLKDVLKALAGLRQAKASLEAAAVGPKDTVRLYDPGAGTIVPVAASDLTAAMTGDRLVCCAVAGVKGQVWVRADSLHVDDTTAISHADPRTLSEKELAAEQRRIENLFALGRGVKTDMQRLTLVKKLLSDKRSAEASRARMEAA